MRDERLIRMSKKLKESVMPFVLLFFLFLFLAWLIIRPLGMPLIWSVMLSYFAYPIYKYLHERLFGGRFTNIAAGLTTAVIVVFMALPLLLLVLFLTKESFRIYAAIVESGVLGGSYADILLSLHNIPYLGEFIYNFNALSGIPIIEVMIDSTVKWATGLLKVVSGEIVSNAFRIFYLLAIVTISSFFIVRDGHLMLSYIMSIMPLSNDARVSIVDRAARMLRSVVYGIVFTAGIQGTLGAVGWWYVGLAHPVFFGFVMFVTGMIPFVGTPVVWIPGSIALFMQGHVQGGLILLAWGFGVVSMVDNFIRPIFISEESKIHVLLIFMGIFGGLFNWGFIGLFLGPLILSLGLFLLDIYRAVITDESSV